jgi:hypothetical protein
MLVAPLVVSASQTQDRRSSARFSSGKVARQKFPMFAQHMLMIWMLAGILVLAFIPAARGSGLLGATVPFWLVIAPALDLIWLSRRQVLRPTGARSRVDSKATTRQARRIRQSAQRRSVHAAVAAPTEPKAMTVCPADRDRPAQRP